MTRGVLILAGDGPRTHAMISECERSGVSYEVIRFVDHLNQPNLLAARLRHFDALRVDSPDRDFDSLAALYETGRQQAEENGFRSIRGSAAELSSPGQIGSPAQLFFGLRRATQLAERKADELGVPVSHRSADIARAHDKLATHHHLIEAGIEMPRLFGPVASSEALMARLCETISGRVFLKLQHGSAAAGMIALACRSNGDMRATTTAVLTSDGPRATRKLQVLSDRTEIARLVDALAPLGLFAERWFPRASIDEGACDLRIVTVRDAVFLVLRASRYPMTNLHLGGSRLPADRLRDRMSEEAWLSVLRTARETACQFPGAMSLGLDVAVDLSFRGHAVLEVNAFGDFVHGLENDGCTPASALLGALVNHRGVAA